MIKCLWSIIDPTMDRPFFSSSPPPGSLLRKSGLQVLRFEYDVPDPTPGEVVTVQATSEADARAIARSWYDRLKDPPTP